MKKLSKTKLKVFQKYFLQQKEDFLSRQNVEIVESFGDEADVAQGLTLNTMLEKLSFREGEHFNQINEALRRIDNGTYGLCQECEEPIPEKRLLAIPYCIYCIVCAEQEEHLAKQYR